MQKGTRPKSYKSIIPMKGTIKGSYGTETREFPVMIIGETKKRYLVELTEFSGENTYTLPKAHVTITDSIRPN